MENRLVRQLEKSFQTMKKREWNRIYVAVDIHDTVMEPTYSEELSHVYYEDALDTLKLMSNNPEICLILWSSSNKSNCAAYKEMLAFEGIQMDYINSNPEVADKHYADYESKFYINLILDDKAGFYPKEDWPALKEYLTNRI